jgi:hypothetical protein
MLQSFLNFLWSTVFFVTSTFGISISTEQQRYGVIEKIAKISKFANTRQGLLQRQLSTPTAQLIHEATFFASSPLTFLVRTKRVKSSI